MTHLGPLLIAFALLFIAAPVGCGGSPSQGVSVSEDAGEDADEAGADDASDSGPATDAAPDSTQGEDATEGDAEAADTSRDVIEDAPEDTASEDDTASPEDAPADDADEDTSSDTATDTTQDTAAEDSGATDAAVEDTAPAEDAASDVADAEDPDVALGDASEDTAPADTSSDVPDEDTAEDTATTDTSEDADVAQDTAEDTGDVIEDADAAQDTATGDTPDDTATADTTTDTATADAADDTTPEDTDVAQDTSEDTAAQDTSSDTATADTATDTAEDTMDEDTATADTLEDTAAEDTATADTTADAPSDTTDTAQDTTADTSGGDDDCVAVDLGSRLGATAWVGDFTDATNATAATCGGADGPDTTLAWTAPADDTYTFRVEADRGAAVLQMLEEDCAGMELTCTSDASFSPIEMTMVAGERVVLVVDSDDAEASGRWVLSIDPAAWAPPLEVCGDGEDNDLDGDGDCGDIDCRAEPDCVVVPPAPADVAPEIEGDATGFPTFMERIRYLFEGEPAIQRGVTPGYLTPSRVSVVRGRVRDAQGAPLAGVAVRVLGDDHTGWTWTAADGVFTIAIPGGGRQTIDLRLDGHLPVQRALNAPARDYGWIDDVVMTARDPIANPVDLTDGVMDVARGSVEADDNGARQATLLFPPGITASMTLANGAVVPLEQMTVRATEYTVGEDGPEAMPGELPGNSAYTYAVELDVDEAVAAGAVQVDFSESVVVYLENYRDFPVGEWIPVGWFDRREGNWQARPNGRVVQIIAVEGGRALLDVDGDGNAEDEATLLGQGVSADELERLAALYPAGAQLWRVAVNHFSPYDLNWPYLLTPNARAPNLSGNGGGPGGGPGAPRGNDGGGDNPGREDDPCKKKGSIIRCENMSLGESVTLEGTGYRAYYESGREGSSYGNILQVPLADGALPDEVKRVSVRVDIAGQRHETSFTPGERPDRYEYAWDGRDLHGRLLVGRQLAKIEVGYVYPIEYVGFDDPSQTSDLISSYRLWGSLRSQIDTQPLRDEPEVLTEFTARSRSSAIMVAPSRGVPNATALGRWSLGIHHLYEPERQILYLGDGSTVGVEPSSLEATSARTLSFRIGSSASIECANISTDRGHRRLCGSAMTFDANGNAIYAGTFNGDGALYLREPGGAVHQLNNGRLFANLDYIPDAPEQLSTLGLGLIKDIEVGPDGSIYIMEALTYARIGISNDYDRTIIRRLRPDMSALSPAQRYARGTLELVAGGSLDYNFEDGALATTIELGNAAEDMTVTSDGSVYVTTLLHSDTSQPCGEDYGYTGDCEVALLRLDPAGNINRVYRDVALGDGRHNFPGAWVRIASNAEGVIVVSNADDSTITRFTPGQPAQSILTEVDLRDEPIGARELTALDYDGDTLAIDSNNNVYFLHGYVSQCIGLIEATGFVRPGWFGRCDDAAVDGENLGPVRGGTDINLLRRLHIDHEDRLHVSVPRHPLNTRPDRTGSQEYWYRMQSPYPNAGADNYVIPSPNGGEFYTFDREGRHRATLIPGVSTPLRLFEYNAQGRLRSIDDTFQGTTTLEYDNDTITITAPDGTQNILTIHEGNLIRLQSPSQDVSLTYGEGGLLEGLTRNGRTQTFIYNEFGRLVSDEDPYGHLQELELLPLPEADGEGYVVLLRDQTRGTTTRFIRRDDGSRGQLDPTGGVTEVYTTETTTRLTTPDGSIIERALAPHPLWGWDAPFVESASYTSPSGQIQSNTETEIEVQAADIRDPFSVSSLRYLRRLNGRTWETLHDMANGQVLRTTPEGSQVVELFDDQGRITSRTFGPGLESFVYTYGDQRRVQQMQIGERVWTYDYTPRGDIRQIQTPDMRQFIYEHDPSGRLTLINKPERATLDYAYDADGFMTSLTVRDGEEERVHRFTPRTEVSDVETSATYTPPGAAAPYTRYLDPSGRWSRSTLPSGEEINLRYNASGLLAGIDDATYARDITYEPMSDRPSELSATLRDAAVTQTIGMEYDGDVITQASWSGPASGQWAYRYDDSRRLTGIRFGSEPERQLTYDLDDHVLQEGDLSFTWDTANDKPTGVSDARMEVSYTFNRYGSLATREHRLNGSLFYRVELHRDATGRVAARDEVLNQESITTTYAYDGAKRLTTVTEDDTALNSYTYDGFDNRTSANGAVATYDIQDRLVSRDATTYSYDLDGALTGRGDDVFAHGPRGELVEALIEGHPAITYDYDFLGRRVARTVAGETTEFLYGHPTDIYLVTQVRRPDGVVTHLRYGASRELVALDRGGQRYYVATDHLGSPRLVVDDQGTVLKEIHYDGAGVATVLRGESFPLALGFAGGVFDPITRLVRMGRRDYEPAAGRWITRDPLLLGGGQSNLYAYVDNDPVNYIDPSGQAAFCFGGSFYLGVGGGGQICYDHARKGVSACAEGGVGYGGGLDLDIAADLPKTGSNFFAEASLGAGPLSASRGFDFVLCDGLPKVVGESCNVIAADVCSKTFKYKSFGDLFMPDFGPPGVPDIDGSPLNELMSPKGLGQIKERIEKADVKLKGLSVQGKAGHKGCGTFFF